MFLKIKRKNNSEQNIRTLPDGELLVRYKNSFDTKIISILFERYTHLVLGVCLKYLKDEDESKDAVMQIFENLIKELKTQEVMNFKSWIYSVSKNHCLMILRKKKSTEKIQEQYFKKIKQEFMESVNNVHQYNKDDINDKIPELKTAIEQLNIEQRKCIELLYLQDKSYKDVAEITGYSLNNVKSYIQNGKRNLKIYLETNDFKKGLI